MTVLSGKLRKLDALLASEDMPEDTMLLSTLDGFLAGLIVSPTLVMPGEWLPHVRAEEELKFTRKQDVQVLFDLIMDHYNDMIGQLDRGGIRPSMMSIRTETGYGNSGLKAFGRRSSSGRRTG